MEEIKKFKGDKIKESTLKIYGDKLDLTNNAKDLNERPEFVFVNKTRKKKK